MASYTLELYKVLDLDPTIESGILGDYPIFDEAHREVLNRKILNHYWNQEIGVETVSMFRLALTRKLDEIMPIMNKQYEISAIEFNQLETIRISNNNISNGVTATTSESTNDSTAAAKSRAVNQELPQTLLSNSGDYATSAGDNVSETEVSATANDTNTVNQDGTQDSVTTGFQGNAALMLLQYRQSLVNVDMMIIEELKNLFMLVWSHGDEFTDHNRVPGYFGYGRFFI